MCSSDLIDVGVGNGDPCLIERAEGGYDLQARDLFFNGITHGFGEATVFPGAVVILSFGDDAIDVIGGPFEFIEREVVLYEQEDDERGADADGEADDIDERKDLVAPEVTQRDEEIVF